MVDSYVANDEFGKWACDERRAVPATTHVPINLPAVPLSSKQALRLRLQFSLVAIDVFAMATAFAVSYILRFGSAYEIQPVQFFVFLVPWYVLVAANGRAYAVDALLDAKAGAERALLSLATTGALLVALLFYMKTGALYSRQFVGVGLLGSAIFIATSRWACCSAIETRWGIGLTNNVLLIDGAPIRPEPGAIVIIADTAAAEEWDPGMLNRIGTFLHNADRVIIAASEERRRRWVAALKGVGVDVEVLARELTALGPLALRQYGPHPTLVVGANPLGLADSLKKRTLDLVVAGSALVVLAPLLVAMAVAIKIDSPGPIFFRQKRVGQGNRIFEIFKFRTMRSEFEDLDGKRSTARGDDRLTRVGSFLRRTSLDELPQLFNVLMGHMSLVGPRPHALGSTAEEALFWRIDGRYWERHGIKPGITGLAQVRGFRGATATKADVVNRVQSDLEYRIGWSLSRDLLIILRTLRVLTHPNAF